MQTDEMIRVPRPQRETAVARALQQLTPLSCRILNASDKPVPLTSAGYLLRFGHSYHLQIAPPFSDEELDAVCLVNVPDFVLANPEVREFDPDGRPVRSIPFRVPSGWSAFWWKLGLDVRADTLDVSYAFKKGREKEVRLYRCPVVVRRRWGMGVFIAAAFGTIVGVGQHVFSEVVLNGRLPEGGLNGLAMRFARNPYSWAWFIVLTVGVLVAGLARQCYMVHKRSRQLKGRFRDKYPAGASSPGAR